MDYSTKTKIKITNLPDNISEGVGFIENLLVGDIIEITEDVTKRNGLLNHRLKLTNIRNNQFDYTKSIRDYFKTVTYINI